MDALLVEPLTTNFQPPELVGLGRVELPTYGLGNRRSIHLSYSPVSLSPKSNMQLFGSRNNLDFAEFPTSIYGSFFSTLDKSYEENFHGNKGHLRHLCRRFSK